MKNAMFSFAGIRLLFKVIYVQYRKSDDGFDKNVIIRKNDDRKRTLRLKKGKVYHSKIMILKEINSSIQYAV